MDERIIAQMCDGWLDKSVDGCINGGMDDCMSRWDDRWVDECIYGRMDR